MCFQFRLKSKDEREKVSDHGSMYRPTLLPSSRRQNTTQHRTLPGNPFGPCLESVWPVFGIRLARVWNPLGLCLESVRPVFGIRLARVWNPFGPCLESVWPVFGILLASVVLNKNEFIKLGQKAKPPPV